MEPKRTKVVSVKQISSLINFLEAHPDLLLGKVGRSLEGRSLSHNLWMECARILNNASSDCVRKSEKGWRSYFNEYKSKLMKKLKLIKIEHGETGTGRTIILTPLQRRLLSILEQDIGDPLFEAPQDPTQQYECYLMESEETEIPSETEIAETIELATSNRIATPPPETKPLAPKVVPLQRPHRRRKRLQEPELSSTTTALIEMEQLNAEVLRENTVASKENAAASRELAATISRLTDTLNRVAAAIEHFYDEESHATGVK